MSVFKELKQSDVKTVKNFLNQLVDITQEDISGSTTRQRHQVFVTGGVGPGVTSSLFQTVYDQDFTLQTANPIFDMTVGLFYSGSTVQDAKTGEDSAGKLLFPSTSLMMREKVSVYKQFAQNLLGESTAQFVAPLNSMSTSDQLDDALFICYKRLFHRDQIKRETFAMKFFQSAAYAPLGASQPTTPNLATTSESGSVIFTDTGAAITKEVTFGGQVSNIVDSSDTSRTVGLMFNDQGVVVLDLAKIISSSQLVTGAISALNGAGAVPQAGQTVIGGPKGGNPRAKFIPDFLTSGSVDNIIDHFCSTRFSSGSETAMAFQNLTNINSTLYFARASADEFNYSSNTSFVDSDNKITVIDVGQEETQRSFTFITSVGLYDANSNMLAVAKLSRPVEKNDEKDLSLRIRLDF